VALPAYRDVFLLDAVFNCGGQSAQEIEETRKVVALGWRNFIASMVARSSGG